MLLRASSEKENGDYDVNSVTDDALDSGVPHSATLRQLTELTISNDWLALAQYRPEADGRIGEQQVVDALVVAAAFNGITRVADSTGIPLDESTERVTQTLREQTGIQKFSYAEKTARLD